MSDIKLQISIPESISIGLRNLIHEDGIILDKWINESDYVSELKDFGCIQKSNSNVWIVTRLGEELLKVV